MLARLRFVCILACTSIVLEASAMDDDDDFFDFEQEDEEEEEGPGRIDEDDTLEIEEESDEAIESMDLELEELVGSESEEIDAGFFEDDEDDAGETKPGEDTAGVYRQQLAGVEGLGTDEEAMAWEQYLAQYPLSLFKPQIEERLDELSSLLYRGPGQIQQDAGTQELNFAQGLLMEPIDPRSRFRAGFEWGFPNWINLMVDYEQQLQRNLGVHGGLRHRFSGWNLEGGARYALIKSTRTNFLLTAIGDVHINLDPIAPGLRTLMAAGKRFDLKGDTTVDVQAQLGPDLMFYPGQFSPRMVGGANVTVNPSDTVKVYMETTMYMKDFGWEEGDSFRFNQLSFGVRFAGKGNTEGGAGASVPMASNYWKYHYGSVLGDFNYYL